MLEIPLHLAYWIEIALEFDKESTVAPRVSPSSLVYEQYIAGNDSYNSCNVGKTEYQQIVDRKRPFGTDGSVLRSKDWRNIFVARLEMIQMERGFTS